MQHSSAGAAQRKSGVGRLATTARCCEHASAPAYLGRGSRQQREHGELRNDVDRGALVGAGKGFARRHFAPDWASARGRRATATAASSSGGPAAALYQQDGPQPSGESATGGENATGSLAPLARQWRSRTGRNLWERMQELVQLSLPLTVTNVSGFTLNCASDAMIGRLGATALSSTTLANAFYGLMGISIIWGGAAGMETLAGQAYGARNLRMMRLVLFRAMVVCWALCVPIALVWQHAEWLLIKLGQCPVMSATSAVYLQALVPSLFAYVLAECMQSYFVCQNNVQPATWAKGITALLGPLFYYVIMFKMDMGLVGAAYAYALCKLTNALLLLGWMAWERTQGRGTEVELEAASGEGESSAASNGGGHRASSTVQPLLTSSSSSSAGGDTPSAAEQQQPPSAGDAPTRGSAGVAAWQAVGAGSGGLAALSLAPGVSLGEVLDLKGCWEYIKYGLPSAAMTLLEWWAYEINVILAGTLPNAEVAVAVLGICLAISGWVYMFPQSLATATTARVSNALGAGDARLACAYFRSALLMVAAQQVLLAAGILACSTHVVRFFCEDPELLSVATGIVPIVACNVLSDGMNVVLNGVLRACGRQALGARLQLCSYWLVGVPLSYCLGVKAQLGIAGFLAAVGCTSFTQAIVCATIISRFNWQEEVKRSQQILEDLSATMDMAKTAVAPG